MVQKNERALSIVVVNFNKSLKQAFKILSYVYSSLRLSNISSYGDIWQKVWMFSENVPF